MDKEDILIVCALEQETNWKELEGWRVIYTGCGKINAAHELTTELFFSALALPLPKLIINFGTAGSRSLPLQTLVDCTKFIERDMDATALGFERGETPYDNHDPHGSSIIIDYSAIQNPISKNCVCGTGDSFVEHVDNEMKEIDVFDMEAYALAKVCDKIGIDFVSYKYITDNADERSANLWLEDCGKGIKEFEKVLKYYET